MPQPRQGVGRSLPCFSMKMVLKTRETHPTSPNSPYNPYISIFIYTSLPLSLPLSLSLSLSYSYIYIAFRGVVTSIRFYSLILWRSLFSFSSWPSLYQKLYVSIRGTQLLLTSCCIVGNGGEDMWVRSLVFWVSGCYLGFYSNPYILP